MDTETGTRQADAVRNAAVIEGRRQALLEAQEAVYHLEDRLRLAKQRQADCLYKLYEAIALNGWVNDDGD